MLGFEERAETQFNPYQFLLSNEVCVSVSLCIFPERKGKKEGRKGEILVHGDSLIGLMLKSMELVKYQVYRRRSP